MLKRTLSFTGSGHTHSVLTGNTGQTQNNGQYAVALAPGTIMVSLKREASWCA